MNLYIRVNRQYTVLVTHRSFNQTNSVNNFNWWVLSIRTISNTLVIKDKDKNILIGERDKNINEVIYISSRKAPGENKKYGFLYFPFYRFSTDVLSIAFSKVFKLNTNYSILIKIATRSNRLF